MPTTEEYKCPELFKDPNSIDNVIRDYRKVDAWSIGITLCYLYKLREKLNIDQLYIEKLRRRERIEWPEIISNAKSGIHSIIRHLL